MKKVRVYGITHGHGSYARVTEGVVSGLRHHGLFAGLVPIDAFDEETSYDGHDAPVGLVVGPPVEGVALLRGCGWHEKKLVMIAPNSSWLPWPLLKHVVGNGVTGFVSPSAWGAGVIRRHLEPHFNLGDGPVEVGVSVYPHGVSSDFRPVRASADKAIAQWAAGAFRVLHLASTARERKGTRELLIAWKLSGLASTPGCHLDIVIDVTRDYLASRVPEMRDFTEAEQRSVTVMPRKDLSAHLAAAFYRTYQLVVQPSRGEGFGLVPLEAAACGVSVIATLATGHTEYAGEMSRGEPSEGAIDWVKVLPDAPVDDGPGAMAPALDVEALARALAERKRKGPRRASSAVHVALDVGEAWSWKHTTERWGKSIGLF